MQYLMPIELLSRLWTMWRIYVQLAWPFLFGHIFIILTIWFGPLKEIRSEIGALRDWRDTDEGTTKCTTVLHEFVEETRQWGAQGILVPMTDFTDRLDSQTSGLIDNLHSRVNLFLVLGIAGTFFAIFQFAVSAVNQLPGGAVNPAQAQVAGQTIAQLLAQNLAMAFPVGFFGLIFTMVGHFVAFRKDSQLRSALTVASGRAMLFRRQAAKGQAAAIQEALQPLANLHEALAHGLQPVFEKLQGQLQSTSDVLKQQVAPLAEAVGRFEAAATSLAAPAAALTQAAQKLPEAFERVEDIQIAERDHLARLQETEDKIHATLEHAAGRFQEAAAEIAGLPPVLRQEFADALTAMREQAQAALTELQSAAGRLAESPEELVATFRRQVSTLVIEALRVWKEQSGNFVETIRAELQTRLELIREHSATASLNLRDAAVVMQNAAATITQVVREAMDAQLENAMRELRPRLLRLEEAIEIQYPAALKNLKEAAEHSGDLAKQAGSATHSMKAILTDFQSAEQQLAEARKDVERAILDLKRAGVPAPAPPPPDVRPEIERVREAIGDLTDVVKKSSLWFRFFGSKRARVREERAAAGGRAAL